MIDWPAFSLILAGAAIGGVIGFMARWLLDLRAHKTQLKEQDLDIIEEWLGQFTGCMKALEWWIQNFMEEQRKRAAKMLVESETEQTRNTFVDMYNVHRVHMEKMAPKISSLEPRFPELYAELRELNTVFKEVHVAFVVPLNQYDSDMEQIPDDATKADVLRVQESHKRPLTDGVIIAQSQFAALFPKLDEIYAKVRNLR